MTLPIVYFHWYMLVEFDRDFQLIFFFILVRTLLSNVSKWTETIVNINMIWHQLRIIVQMCLIISILNQMRRTKIFFFVFLYI